MRNILIILIISISFLSSDAQTKAKAHKKLIKKAAKELCACMDRMNENPMDGATCMQEFGKKEDYQKIEQDEFMKAMHKACPDHARRFEELANYGSTDDINKKNKRISKSQKKEIDRLSQFAQKGGDEMMDSIAKFAESKDLEGMGIGMRKVEKILKLMEMGYPKKAEVFKSAIAKKAAEEWCICMEKVEEDAEAASTCASQVNRNDVFRLTDHKLIKKETQQICPAATVYAEKKLQELVDIWCVCADRADEGQDSVFACIQVLDQNKTYGVLRSDEILEGVKLGCFNKGQKASDMFKYQDIGMSVSQEDMEELCACDRKKGSEMQACVSAFIRNGEYGKRKIKILHERMQIYYPKQLERLTRKLSEKVANDWCGCMENIDEDPNAVLDCINKSDYVSYNLLGDERVREIIAENCGDKLEQLKIKLKEATAKEWCGCVDKIKEGINLPAKCIGQTQAPKYYEIYELVDDESILTEWKKKYPKKLEELKAAVIDKAADNWCGCMEKSGNDIAMATDCMDKIVEKNKPISLKRDLIIFSIDRDTVDFRAVLNERCPQSAKHWNDLIDKAAKELCACMDRMNENPMDGAICMQEFGKKKEYQGMGQEEFMKAMHKACPAAAKRFEELAWETTSDYDAPPPTDEIIDKAAKELCACMDKMDESPIDWTACLQKFLDKKEYKPINQRELMKVMHKVCPEGAKKFEELAKIGE